MSVFVVVFECGKQSEKIVTSGVIKIMSIVAASHSVVTNFMKNLKPAWMKI